MKRHGHPHTFVTDKLRYYGAAMKDLGLPNSRETGRWLKQRVFSLNAMRLEARAP
jgi:putative transposase